MYGSHDYVSFPERRQQFWRARHAELNERAAHMMEQSRISIDRSKALLERTRRQVDERAQVPSDQDHLSN
jgi:hypothetical protein